eukprot:CAMPEP_0172321156 /NCGR_PEP_ID=MMETSP1058-20130122/42511_1 /TAXON_ID=83371 /ORGANISM="Detonula confervacea, Strain CCMP 353" /LENGTH=163 /DNA_ID=CAMNT_0013036587 /DNA_START=364 /DNA_END=852 /DNA_ORIENTATION=-
MTMKQSLKLCQRRRPVADPNSAFLDQLRAYEKDCRTWGHLTAVDDALENVDAGKKVSKKDGNDGDNSGISAGGEKRKADNIGCSNGKKKRIVGPAIGPIGPPRGPVKSAAIGPSMGPPTKVSSEKTRMSGAMLADGKGKDEKKVVGPASRPPVKMIFPMKPPT